MGNKLLKVVVAAAAIGGVCYAFRDKIKESKVYQSLDVDDKVEKVKTTIKEKMPVKDDTDRDYFTLNEEDDTAATEAAESDSEAEAAATPAEETISGSKDVSESTADVTARVDDLLSDIPEITIASEDISEPKAADEKDDGPILYENEGLSDVSEDLDVIEEQDKLDI